MSYGELSNTQETMVLPMLQMKNIRGKPYITVSAKGMINGLSNIPNDGADFGPDTTKGATAPGQYGGAYTSTVGIQEALNYVYAEYQNNGIARPVKILASGPFAVSMIISETILIPNTRIVIEGEGSLYNGTMIQGNMLPLMALAEPTQQYQAVVIKNLVLQYTGGSTSGYVLDLLNSGNSNWFRVEHILIAKNNAGAGAIRMDGCTQSYINDMITTGVAGTSSWISGSDAVNIYNSVLIDNFNLEGESQVTFFRDLIYGQIQYTFTSYSATLLFMGCFLANVTNYDIAIIIPSTVNGGISSLTLSGCYFTGGNSSGNPPEYIHTDIASSNSYLIVTIDGIEGQNNNGVNIPLIDNYTNVVLKGYEKLDISGFTLPSVTTPSVPSSGTAQENTNPYAVDVYAYGYIVICNVGKEASHEE